MKIPISRILPIPTDPAKAVLITAEALNNCDLSTMPVGTKLHISHGTLTVELERQEDSIRARTFAKIYYGNDGRAEHFANLAELAFALVWATCPDGALNEDENGWTTLPTSAISVPVETEIGPLIESVEQAHQVVIANVAGFLTNAATGLRFLPMSSEEVGFKRN